MKNDQFVVKAGDTATFRVLEWFHEGWEFGRPALMLAPVIRIEHDNSADYLIEKVCFDLVCNDKPLERIYEGDQQEIDWRGWNLSTLRRRFAQASRGVRFPVAGYTATTRTIQFHNDERGELSWSDAK